MVGVAFALYLILVVQLAYPRSRSLPMARLPNGQYISAQSKAQIEAVVRDFNNKPLTIQADAKTYTITLDEIGIPISKSTADKYADYPITQRLIPFSILWAGSTQSIDRDLARERLDIFIKRVVDDNSVTPKSASYTLDQDGVYKVTSSSTGTTYKKEEVTQKLSQVIPSDGKVIKINGVQTKPAIVEAMLTDGVKKLNDIRKQTIKLDTTTISGTTLASWASLKVDDTSKTVEVTYDTTAIKEWLKGIKTGQATAKPKVVTYVDHVLAGETPGTPGKSVDADKTSAALVQAIKEAKNTAGVTYVDMPIATQIIQTYSPTNNGLTLLMQDWQAKYKGMQASVVYKELGGQGRHAELAPNQSTFAASIYKLYVAKYLFDAIATGKISVTEQVRPDKNTQQCLEAMIVVSDNACPEAIMSRFGKPTIDAATRADGFGATSISNTTTTASDTAAFLERLQSSGLLNATDTNTFMDMLRRQIYRQAIPDGSRGATVFDKVGFYGTYWHDAAIVQKGSSRYVLVIMTKNASPKAIADLAAEVMKLQ